MDGSHCLLFQYRILRKLNADDVQVHKILKNTQSKVCNVEISCHLAHLLKDPS